MVRGFMCISCWSVGLAVSVAIAGENFQVLFSFMIMVCLDFVNFYKTAEEKCINLSIFILLI